MKKILILAANPKDTQRLRLDQEVRDIKEGLHRSKHREQFDVRSQWAVRLRDLRRALLDEEPQIIHFCGHGEVDGLMVEEEQGNAVLVNGEALAGLFGLFEGQIECVLLNACYSETQAKAINQHIPYVIGMSTSISDEAALEFAVGFYDALGAGKSFENAFKFGCNALQLYNLPEHLTPLLLVKPGISNTQTETPGSVSSQLQSKLSLGQRQRLRQRLDELKESYNTLTEKIKLLRKDYAIETNGDVKFRLKYKLDEAEAERANIERQMDEIDTQLQG